MEYLLGIDNGGTFSKAALFDTDGNQISVSGVRTRMITPKPGYTERDLEELWEANATAIRQTIEKSGISPALIRGVSFSGHGKGLYLVGEDGRPAYNGIISTDMRAWKQIRDWYADGTNRKVWEKTYQEILACQPVALLAWLKENDPEALARTKYVFGVNDYIRFRMTGEAFAEQTGFTGGNLVSLKTGDYDPELFALLGLEEVLDKLPPLRRSAELSGTVTPQAARETLLPAGTPVAAGMFDVDACGIAAGLQDEKDMCMIAGTWSINEYLAKEPITNGTVDLNSMFCIPGYYLVEESSPTSAGNMEWFIQRLMKEEGAAYRAENRSIYDLTNEMVESVDTRQSDVVFLPFLNGSNEDALAKGSFIGLTEYHEKRHLLRAVYEGIVFSHITHVNKLLRNRERPESIRLAGGAANSKVWVQIFADALQIPIDTIAGLELGAQGAAMAAGIATGLFQDYHEAIGRMVRITNTVQPRAEYAEVYAEKYRTYRAVIDALSGVWQHFEH